MQLQQNKTRFFYVINNMMNKIYTTVFTLLVTVLNLHAEPGTYYQSLDSSTSCSSFKTALFNHISSGTVELSYGSVDDYYFRTDSKPAESGGGFVIVDKYSSDIPDGLDSCNYRFETDFCSAGGTATVQCSCYIKEHTFPSSWFNDQLPMRSDMHLLFPADNYINNAKSNFPIGYVQTPSITSFNGTKIGTSNSTLNNGFSSSNVFEPIDSFKGDFARVYLYVVTRYQTQAAAWNFSTSGNVLAGNTYPALDPWILQLCIKWHKLDPPSAFEQKRNDSVFAIQRNRNPYVDYPHWAEKVFGENGNSGSCVNTAVGENKSLPFSVYPNPVRQGMLFITIEKFLSEPVFIEITDMLGSVVKVQQSAVVSGSLGIDVNDLAIGSYLLRIRYKDDVAVNAFIVQ
jgi:endonuclease I